jgi:DNA invertase Pin-like site-specific DNA recombinase
VKAATYLRMSIDNPIGIDRQRQDCMKLCEGKGWTPVEYVDNDTSASNGKRRKDYERMLTDVEASALGAVVAWDLDRLHRRPIELERFMDLADEHRLKLATVSGDIDLSTAQGRLTARLKGAVARHEIEHKSDRQRRAARQKAERGLPQWARAFGYLGDTHQLDPRTAPLVADAYAAVLAGASLSDVCGLFNDAGALTLRGKAWTSPMVSQFLRDPRNAGLRAYGGEIIGLGTWPPLVDESTWRATQHLLDAPSRKPGRRTVRRHRLTGVLRCGACGHHLSGIVTAYAALTYRCRQCFGVSVRGEHVEPLLMAVVTGRLAQPDAIDLLKAELHDEAEAESLRLQANTLTTELDNIGVERADGLLTGRQAKIATDRINEKLAAITARQTDQERLRVFDGLPLGEPDVADAIEGLSPDRLRAVIDVLMTVTIAPVGRGGGRAFNPERVHVEWK